jgi:hypothetical protein
MRNPVQELHVNMTKLAVMVSKFLIEAYGTNEKAYLNTYERYLHALEEWSSSLPQSLRYFPDHANSGSSVKLSIEDEIASVSRSFYIVTWQADLTCPSITSRHSISHVSYS